MSAMRVYTYSQNSIISLEVALPEPIESNAETLACESPVGHQMTQIGVKVYFGDAVTSTVNVCRLEMKGYESRKNGFHEIRLHTCLHVLWPAQDRTTVLQYQLVSHAARIRPVSRVQHY
eukprot:1818717-Amphidinium_carterae.2